MASLTLTKRAEFLLQPGIPVGPQRPTAGPTSSTLCRARKFAAHNQSARRRQSFMLPDDQFIVVKVFNQSLRQNKIVLSRRCEREEVILKKLRVGYAVKAQVLPNLRHVVGVVDAGDAISELFRKVDSCRERN